MDVMNHIAMMIGWGVMAASGLFAMGVLATLAIGYLYNKIGDAVSLKKLWDGYNKSLEMDGE